MPLFSFLKSHIPAALPKELLEHRSLDCSQRKFVLFYLSSLLLVIYSIHKIDVDPFLQTLHDYRKRWDFHNLLNYCQSIKALDIAGFFDLKNQKTPNNGCEDTGQFYQR